MANVSTSLRFAMEFPIALMVPMNIAARRVASANLISLCAATPSVWTVSGVVMVRTIAATIPMKKVVIPSPVVPPVVMMNSNVAVVTVFPNPSSVTIPMIVVMALMKSVAVSSYLFVALAVGNRS